MSLFFNTKTTSELKKLDRTYWSIEWAMMMVLNDRSTLSKECVQRVDSKSIDSYFPSYTTTQSQFCSMNSYHWLQISESLGNYFLFFPGGFDMLFFEWVSSCPLPVSPPVSHATILLLSHSSQRIRYIMGATIWVHKKKTICAYVLCENTSFFTLWFPQAEAYFPQITGWLTLFLHSGLCSHLGSSQRLPWPFSNMAIPLHYTLNLSYFFPSYHLSQPGDTIYS